METAPRLPANDQPKPRHQRPNETTPGTHDSRHYQSQEPNSGGWEQILTKHEQLRQLIKQGARGIDKKGRRYQPNMVLDNCLRGPISQAYGWTKIALDDNPQPEFDRWESPDNYRGDPVEQSLLWLIINFKPDQVDPEIVSTVELLSDGLIQQAHDKLEKYING